MQHTYCIHCGCDIKEKSFETQGCEEGCYPKLMSEQEWGNFKQKNNIQIS